jgi:hypothetical protein
VYSDWHANVELQISSLLETSEFLTLLPVVEGTGNFQITLILTKLYSNCQQPQPGDTRNINTLQDPLKMSSNDERPTGKKTTCEWDDGGK